MTLSWDRMAELAIANLSSEERCSSVVYLDQQLLQAGVTIPVGMKQVHVSWRAVVAFVDLEPGVNWGHRCRYLLINAESGEIQSHDNQFPPFLIDIPPHLRVVWKGKDVQSWALAIPQATNE